MFVVQVLLLLLSVSTILVQVQASENPNADASQNSVESSGSSGKVLPVSSKALPEQSNNPDNLQVAIIEPEEGIPIEPPPPKSSPTFPEAPRYKSPREKAAEILIQVTTFLKIKGEIRLKRSRFGSAISSLEMFEFMVKFSEILSPSEKERLLNHPNVNQIRDQIKTVTEMGGDGQFARLTAELEALAKLKAAHDKRPKSFDIDVIERRIVKLDKQWNTVSDAMAPVETALEAFNKQEKFMQKYRDPYRKLFDQFKYVEKKLGFFSCYMFRKAQLKVFELMDLKDALVLEAYEECLDLSAGKDYKAAIEVAIGRFDLAMQEAKKCVDELAIKKECSIMQKVAYTTAIGTMAALGLTYWFKPELFNWGTGSSSRQPLESNVTQVDLNSTSNTTIESTQLPSSLNSVYIAILVVLAMVAIVAGLVYYFAVYRKNRKSGTKGKDIEACKVSTESSLNLGHKSSKTKRSSKQSPSGFSPSGFNDSTDACTTANSSGKNRSKTNSVPSSAASQ